MCLSIEVDSPDHVLSKGEHAGYEFVTVHNGMGYRCGYVRVPKGHPWHGLDEMEVEAEVHGGLTFGRADKPCSKGGADDAYWFGFDCAHGGDAPDPELPVDAPPSPILGRYGVVRTQDYVESECRSLCEQAARAAKLNQTVGAGEKSNVTPH